MPRVLIVCDGDGDPKLCFSPTHVDGPAFREAIQLISGRGKLPEMVPTPQSQIDRFSLPGEEC